MVSASMRLIEWRQKAWNMYDVIHELVKSIVVNGECIHECLKDESGLFVCFERQMLLSC
jgi:hypothetical protein